MSNKLDTANDAATNGYPKAADVVAGFTTTNNYRIVNIGQVKNTAVPFYHWLMNESRTNSFPWDGASVTNDFGAAAR